MYLFYHSQDNWSISQRNENCISRSSGVLKHSPQNYSERKCALARTIFVHKNIDATFWGRCGRRGRSLSRDGRGVCDHRLHRARAAPNGAALTLSLKYRCEDPHKNFAHKNSALMCARNFCAKIRLLPSILGVFLSIHSLDINLKLISVFISWTRNFSSSILP